MISRDYLPRRPRRRRSNWGRVLFGVTLALTGIAGALYIGIVVMLVGGINEILAGLHAHPQNSNDIAWGIVRVVFCESAGLIAWVGIFLGALVADD